MTLPLNIFWNVIFSCSIVVFSLNINIIVQKQPVLMYNNNNKTVFRHHQIRDVCPVHGCVHTCK